MRCTPTTPFAPLRAALLAVACLAPWSLIQAQTPAQATTPAAAADSAAQQQEDRKEERAQERQNQKIERIHVEDSNARVDELRVGGQTQSITVKPAGNMPAYEVQPNNTGRTKQGEPGAASSTGPTMWNVLKF